MSLVFIGLGSNLGEGRVNLISAWKKLGEFSKGTLLGISSPYASSPVDMDSSNWFTNAVGVLETRLTPEALLETMLQVEASFGRDRLKGKDRTVDLDIIYFDDLILTSEAITVPHPEIENRMFVLAPLAELAPDHLHPVLQKTTLQMKRNLQSPEQVVQKQAWAGKDDLT